MSAANKAKSVFYCQGIARNHYFLRFKCECYLQCDQQSRDNCQASQYIVTIGIWYIRITAKHMKDNKCAGG